MARIWTHIPSAAIAALLISTAAWGQDVELPQPIADYFGEHSGCALIKRQDRHRSLNIEFNPEQCGLPLAPCSTFKIPNALIGLQTGVVSGPDHLKEWDGEIRWLDVWNQDHTLASSIRYSTVWYFQDLARDVGEERMQKWLDVLEYGNRDISGGIDQFWLRSSLKITAHDQLDLLRQLTHDNLPFDEEYQHMVQDMMKLGSELDGQLHGKTGSCPAEDGDEAPDHGWFIGWVASGSLKNPETTLFVINIRGAGAWGPGARDIALRLLGDLQNQINETKEPPWHTWNPCPPRPRPNWRTTSPFSSASWDSSPTAC